jgi:adenosine deaminase
MARTGIAHTFLPGTDLWLKRDDFTRVVASCANQPPGAETPKADCSTFLRDNARAAQEWELERRFRAFESSLP